MGGEVRADPQEAKKRFLENWDKGPGEGKYYLKAVRILVSKLFPLLEVVVFMNSSEEGELERRKRTLYYSI